MSSNEEFSTKALTAIRMRSDVLLNDGLSVWCLIWIKKNIINDKIVWYVGVSPRWRWQGYTWSLVPRQFFWGPTPSATINLCSRYFLKSWDKGAFNIWCWLKQCIESIKITPHNDIQWHLFIVDMPYSRHLSIADTNPKNGWYHGHSLIEKSLYSGQK